MVTTTAKLTTLQVCTEENDSGELKVPLEKATLRAATYAGVGVTTVMRFKKSSWVPKKRCHRNKYEVDNFYRDVIRRVVHDMLSNGRCVPTLNTISMAVRERIDFPGKKDYLRKVLKELGFVWRRCETNRSVLMERSDIVVARMNFLRAIRRYRSEGRPIVYTDKTYIHTSHRAKKCWQSDEVSLKVPFSKGDRLILVHAGTQDGFIEGARLLFKSKSSSGDYHSEMNWTNFSKWMNEKLIPNLPPRSVIVVDNAPYHNIQTDKCPVQTTRKADIKGWLDRHHIQYTSTMLKAELLEICRRHRPPPAYVLDATLQEHGHTCLRLPQYHAELNAIELIWASVKRRVADHKMTFKMNDLVRLTEEMIEATIKSSIM